MDFSDNERELNYEEEDPLNKFETYTQEDLHIGLYGRISC
jgi:hypothetical protein